MNITVILCTFNRCHGLAHALDSIAHLTLSPPDSWEVLVVDNNSTDRTRAVVEDFSQRYPGRFRYLFEPVQGKSFALNSGIRESHGDVLAFLDDDVTVEPTWLERLTAGLHDGPWTGAGGRIVPDCEFSLPPWIPLMEPAPLAPLAISYPDREAGPLVEPPYGNNMAFKREMFERYGNFRTDLGPGVGRASLHMGEDSEFGNRLLEAGERLWYEPSAVVYHAVPSDRVQKRYFLHWWYNKGRAEVRTSGIPADTKWFVGKVPLQVFRRLAAWTLRWLFSFEQRRRFGAKLKVWGKLGEIRECCRLSHEGSRES